MLGLDDLSDAWYYLSGLVWPDFLLEVAIGLGEGVPKWVIGVESRVEWEGEAFGRGHAFKGGAWDAVNGLLVGLDIEDALLIGLIEGGGLMVD